MSIDPQEMKLATLMTWGPIAWKLAVDRSPPLIYETLNARFDFCHHRPTDCDDCDGGFIGGHVASGMGPGVEGAWRLGQRP